MAWNGSDTEKAKVRGEGEQRRGKFRSSTSTHHFNYKALVAGLIVVIGGGLAAWMMMRGERGETADDGGRGATRPTAIAEVKPAVVTNAVKEVVSEKQAPVNRPKPAPWRDPKLTEAQRAAVYEKALEEMPLPKASTNQLFRSKVEQVLGWVFTKELGDAPPPLPKMSDHEFVHLQEILNQENDVTEDDDERAADTKRTVDFVKKELKAYVEKGGDPDDFLVYYHDKLRSAYTERQIAMSQVMKVMSEEPELGDDYVKKVNESLSKKGIKPIEISPRMRSRADAMKTIEDQQTK